MRAGGFFLFASGEMIRHLLHEEGVAHEAIDAVEEGRAVFQNIRKFLTYVLVHNVDRHRDHRQRGKDQFLASAR
jgi:hypothetical protein